MSGLLQNVWKLYNMAPTVILRRHLKTLSELQKLTRQRKIDWGKHLRNEDLDLLIDSAYNIYHAKLKRINKKHLQQLRPFKKSLIYLSNAKNSIEKRRKRLSNQSGDGLISLLISTAIPLIISLLSKKKKK